MADETTRTETPEAPAPARVGKGTLPQWLMFVLAAGGLVGASFLTRVGAEYATRTQMEDLQTKVAANAAELRTLRVERTQDRRDIERVTQLLETATDRLTEARGSIQVLEERFRWRPTP